MNKVLQAKRNRKAKAGKTPKKTGTVTAPTPAKITLPPLRVGVYEYGSLVHTVDIPDPRVNFCRFWDELHSREPHVAVRPLPLAIEASQLYAVILLSKGCAPEVVYVADELTCAAWLEEWNRDPLKNITAKVVPMIDGRHIDTAPKKGG